MENVSEMSEDTTFNALKYKRYASVDTEVGGCWIDAGTIYWVNDVGQLHREDGPAVEDLDGTKLWYLNGGLHCEDGPAVEWADGSKFWFHHGIRHRENGPAVEWANGLKEWHQNGEFINYG